VRPIFISSVATLAAAILLAGILTAEFHASTGPIPLNCNRACLENVVDQYLTALAARDPKRLPLSADVKYTENDQVIPIGDGFGKTVEGRGKYTHIFSDPEFGQVAYMGTMMEAGAPILLSLRLRVELGRITEIESVLYKPGGGGPAGIADMDKPYQPEQFWFKSIPPAQRMSRQELIAIADGYFTGLQKNDGKGINGTGTYPFTEDCHRIENGAPTTNRPRPANEAPGTINAFAMDCLSQFKLGYYFVVQNIHDRRYPVVDQERATGTALRRQVERCRPRDAAQVLGRDCALRRVLRVASEARPRRAVDRRPGNDSRAAGIAAPAAAASSDHHCAACEKQRGRERTTAWPKSERAASDHGASGADQCEVRGCCHGCERAPARFAIDAAVAPGAPIGGRARHAPASDGARCLRHAICARFRH